MQITLFPNQGLCIALKIHHAACDGFSSLHFLKSWASSNRSSPPPPLPSLNRSIPDSHSLYSKLSKKLPQKSLFSQSPPPPPSPSLTTSTFTLPSHKIQTLKLHLSSLPSSFHISSFAIAAALSWTCLLKTREKNGENDDSHLFFSVDWRTRMRPPPPANYFGNCLGCPCFVVAGEKDGFFMACEVIGKAIDGIGDDVYEGMEGVMEKVRKVLPYKPLSIAGSPKLRVYGVDFGWGRPRKVEVTLIGGMGSVSMAEGRDDEGGVEIGVVLMEDEMVEFGKEFDMFLSKYD